MGCAYMGRVRLVAGDGGGGRLVEEAGSGSTVRGFHFSRSRVLSCEYGGERASDCG